MDGISWLRSLEGSHSAPRPAEWLDVLVKAEEQEHPSRWLADQMGVHIKSAQRYLAAAGGGHGGKGANPTREPAASAARRLIRQIDAERQEESDAERTGNAAGLLRMIDSISPGTVAVKSKSKPFGPTSMRHITSALRVDKAMMNDVATAWEDGDEQAAADALSDAIIRAYGDEGDVDELDASLLIVDYPDGIDYA